MVDLQQADLEVEKIYALIKQQKNGIKLDDIATTYSSRAVIVPYVVGLLLADGKVKTEQRGKKLFCMAIEPANLGDEKIKLSKGCKTWGNIQSQRSQVNHSGMP